MHAVATSGFQPATARLNDLLDELASETRAPAGGSGAALVVALAAGLVAKGARLSRPSWEDAGGAVAQAESLRARAVHLAEADAVAFEEALTVLAGTEALRASERDQAIRAALERAADIPLLIAQTAYDVTLLAADVAQSGNPDMGADAAVAAVLAEAAARSARHLVEVNLATIKDDERVEQSERFAGMAAAAMRRAIRAD